MRTLHPKVFFNALKERGIDYFCGVPGPILKDFSAFVAAHTKPTEHIVTTNEGSALGVAAGHYLATGGFPLSYMENAGLGNALNPLLCLTHAEAYSIPVLMVVGWLGSSSAGVVWPHAAQGRLTEDILRAAEVPYAVLSAGHGDERRSVEAALDVALGHMQNSKTPYAFLVPHKTFEEYGYERVGEGVGEFPMTRKEAIEQVLRQIDRRDIVVGAVGIHSHEITEIQEKAGMQHGPYFLPVGSIGHCAPVAAGMAVAKPEKQVVCLDGDGAFLMHMGSVAAVGAAAAVHPLGTGEAPPLSNYKHVVLNNGAYGSAGGQPTASLDVSLTQVASACGFRIVREEPAMSVGETVQALRDLKQTKGPAFLEIFVRRDGHSDFSHTMSTLRRSKEEIVSCLAN